MTTRDRDLHGPPLRGSGARALALLLLVALAGCGGGEAEGHVGDGAADSTRSTVTSSALFGGGVRSDASGRTPRPEPPPGIARRDAGRDTQAVDLSRLGFNVGSSDAPIRVVEFSDFGCGYCKRFHAETYPTLKEEYIETGKVVWKYVPFVLGMFPNAVEAAMAGECAGAQGREPFAAMRDRLFEEQGEWRKSSEPYALFKEYAREVGLEGERFDRCVDERVPAERVRANVRAGRRVGVRGTPMFVVEGFPLQGALPLEAFREIFDKMLARTGATSESGS